MSRSPKAGSRPEEHSNNRKRILTFAIAALVMLLLVLVRVAVGAYSELNSGKDAEQQLYLDVAVVHYARALEWYVPGLPAMDEAADRLMDIGNAARDVGDAEMAFMAYSYLRSALYAGRSFYTPREDIIAVCDEQIAELLSKVPDVQRYHPDMDRGQLKEMFLSYSRRFPGPSVGWSVLAILGFSVWIGSTAVFLYKSARRDSHVMRLLYAWTPIFLAGYCIWLLSLYLA